MALPHWLLCGRSTRGAASLVRLWSQHAWRRQTIGSSGALPWNSRPWACAPWSPSSPCPSGAPASPSRRCLASPRTARS
eukprot:7348263-Pyramimonas_sp.AAC.1